MSRKLVIVIIALCSQNFAALQAFAANRNYYHVPPQFELGKELPVVFTAPGAEQVKMLICDIDGVKVKSMTSNGNDFETTITFENLALIKYQFLVYYSGHETLETGYYWLRQPSNEILEERLRELNNQLSDLSTRIKQVQNGLVSLEGTDAGFFNQRRSEEMGKAVLALRQKEKELEDLKLESKKKMAAWSEEMTTALKGKLILDARQNLESEDKSYWPEEGGSKS